LGACANVSIALAICSHLLTRFLWLDASIQLRAAARPSKSSTESLTHAPPAVVLDAFTGGGAQADQKTTENHTQFNEFLSWQAGKHQWKAGINAPEVAVSQITLLNTYPGPRRRILYLSSGAGTV
jgi:hypothetical protein